MMSVLTLSVRGPSLYVRICNCRRQILTYKDGPILEKNKIFIMAVDHNIGMGGGFQMKQKELTKTFMMISN